jgi:hypothetical protein
MTKLSAIEMLQKSEIAWVFERAEVEKPFDDMEYTEHTFSGFLPHHMAKAIKHHMADYFTGDGTYSVVDTEPTFQSRLMCRFGTSKRTANHITFIYSLEVNP